MDIKGEIKTRDKYDEALPHLNDQSYIKAKKLYNRIFSLQDDNNAFVSTYIHQLECSITSGFSNHGIREVMHEPEFYSLNYMLRALQAASLSDTRQQLHEDEQVINGIRYTDFRLAQIMFARCRSEKKNPIRELINIEYDKIQEKIRNIDSNIQNMNVLLNDFKEEINKIIHEADRSGLRGQCLYENKQYRFLYCKNYPMQE